MSKSLPPPGTSDIFPEEAASWRFIEESAIKIFSLYGYGELRTPVFEYTEVFERGIGGDTEVVQKEMYTFEDRGGRSLTLRPEGTAGVMRALLNTDVMNGNEKRVFYMGPMFRGERPAAGRKRQFHQVGVENVGHVAPELDAESILMLMHFLEESGIRNSKLQINTRGTAEDRKPAEEKLREHFSKSETALCEDCKARLSRNVWRILDCKQPQCQEFINSAPDATTFFSPETRGYFDKVCNALSAGGADFEVSPRLVRGLDYYVHTVFEVSHPGLGAQNAIAGGGRYEIFLPENKKPVIGVGFAAGIERLLMARESLDAGLPEKGPGCVFLAALGEKARDFNMALASKLRHAGIPVIAEVDIKSLKAQMRAADRVAASFALICGDNELEKNLIVCKNMKTGEQTEMESTSIGEFLKSIGRWHE
ncbi:MAG: histidine--tRNA ligase [Lentisphaerae bacterium GWF2_45_14]|nr:MAG: histidine--tRNA ligase [Lentisphaerae bacterium GWF2_45_14]